MKFTEEDKEIVATVRRNVPLILATIASTPLFFVTLASGISGSYISFVFFCMAQVFFVLAYHREQKWSKKKSFLLGICCFILGIVFFDIP